MKILVRPDLTGQVNWGGIFDEIACFGADALNILLGSELNRMPIPKEGIWIEVSQPERFHLRNGRMDYE